MEGSRLLQLIDSRIDKKINDAQYNKQTASKKVVLKQEAYDFPTIKNITANISPYTITEEENSYSLYIPAGSCSGFVWGEQTYTIHKTDQEQYLAIAIKDVPELVELTEGVYLTGNFILAFIYVPLNASGWQEGFLDGDNKLQIIYGLPAQTIFTIMQYNVLGGGITPDNTFQTIVDGNLLIEGTAAIVSADNGVVIDPTGLNIYDIEYEFGSGVIDEKTMTRLATFNQNGLYFYDGENEEAVSYFTKGEAKVGGWKILPDKIYSLEGTTEEVTSWASETDYEVNDIVEVESVYYKCISKHTSSLANEPNSGAEWEAYWEVTTINNRTLLINSDGEIATSDFEAGKIAAAPDWNYNVNYTPRDAVYHEGFFVCYKEHYSGANTDKRPPDGIEWQNYWVSSNVSSADAWSIGNAYVPGQIVEQSGAYFVCILEHTAGEINKPPIAPEYTTYWADLDYSSASARGWRISSDGNAFFNDMTVFGTVYSKRGNIAGWEIAPGYVANGNIVLASKGEIFTANYIPEVSGWKIRYDGLAEFNDAVVRGSLFSDVGYIGGWAITETEITSHSHTEGTYTSNSSGEITLAQDAVELIYVRDMVTGNLYKQSDLTFVPPRTITGVRADTTHVVNFITAYDGITINSAGTIGANYTPDVSGWIITADGNAEFNNVAIRSTEGNIGGWTITPEGLEANGILIKNSGTIETSDYVAGSTGWSIDQSGFAEFNNIEARGYISSTEGYIGGWQIDSGKLYAGTDIVLDSSAKKISVASDNVQLGYGIGINQHGFKLDVYNYFVYDSGDSKRKFRVGSSTKYLKFDGTNLIVDAGNTTIDASGNLTASNVDLTGTISATTGDVGGWAITSSNIKSPNENLRLNATDNRLEIFADSSYKMAFGYLGGIGTHDSTEYGIWIGAPDALYIEAPLDGDEVVQQIKGDWIVKNDADIKIRDGSGIEVLRIGTDAGERGLHLFDTLGNKLAKYTSAGILINMDSTGTMKIGNEVTAGNDGIYINDYNLWYSDGTFKIGDINHGITWNGTNLIVNGSGEFTGTIHATAGEIDTSLLVGDISADRITTGTLTTGVLNLAELFAQELILNTSGVIKSENVTDINTGIGLFMDYLGNVRFGDPAGNYLKWSGSTLDIHGSGEFTGDVTATTGTIGGWSIDGETLQSVNARITLDAANDIIYTYNNRVKIGNNVNTASWYGIKVYNDYWETDGLETNINLGGGKFTYDGTTLNITGTIHTNAGDIGGWIIASDSIYKGASETIYSIKLDSVNSNIGINSSTSDSPRIKLGMNVTDTGKHGLVIYDTTNNYWIWDDYNSNVQFKVGNDTKYLDYNGSSLVLKTNDIDIQSDNFILKTQDIINGYLGLGASTYNENGGIWMGYYSNEWRLSAKNIDGSNYFIFDGNNVSLSGTIYAKGGEIDGDLNITPGNSITVGTNLEIGQEADSTPFIRAGDVNSEYYKMQPDGLKYHYNSQPAVEWVKVRMKLNNVLFGVSFTLDYSNDGGNIFYYLMQGVCTSNGWNEIESPIPEGVLVLDDFVLSLWGHLYDDAQTEVEEIELYVKTNIDNDYVLIASSQTYEDWSNMNLYSMGVYTGSVDAGRAFIRADRGATDAEFHTPSDWFRYVAGTTEYKLSSIISSGTIEFNGYYIEKQEILPTWMEDYEVVLIPIYQPVARAYWYTDQNDQYIHTEILKSGRSFTARAYTLSAPNTNFQKEPEEKGYGSWNVMANVTNCKRIEFDIFHWGLFRMYRGHYSHEYDTAYTGAITWKQASVGSDVLIDWSGGTVADTTINGIVGGALPRNMTIHITGVETPIHALYRYLVLKSPV